MSCPSPDAALYNRGVPSGVVAPPAAPAGAGSETAVVDGNHVAPRQKPGNNAGGLHRPLQHKMKPKPSPNMRRRE